MSERPEERETLAARIARMMQRRRLERAGEPVPEHAGAFGQLPAEDQRSWLDVADCLIELTGERTATLRLRRHLDDFDRYAITLAADRQWRDQMLRAMITEMRAELAKLERLCELP